MFNKICVLLLLVITPMTTFSNEIPSRQEIINALSDPSSDMPEQERKEALEFFTLDWKESGKHHLPLSNSTISLPEGYYLLVGEDAKKARELDHSLDNEDLEALVYDPFWNDIIVFENIDSGFITIDDWAEIDSKALLNTITENTEKANIERRKKGFKELHVVGWMQEPTLDRSTNTVYWALEGRGEKGDGLVNSVALRLGRKGYERIVWITEKDSYVPFGGHLDTMLNAHSFDQGYRYQDFVDGDKIAEYGIAALVAASVGGKVMKATGLLIILKKFGGFALAALGGLFYKLKNLFRKGKESPLES